MNINNIHVKIESVKCPFCANFFVQYGGSVLNRNFLIISSSKLIKKEIHLDLLRKLEASPELTQRKLSQEMGVSLGKINYCMKKLIEKGWIKLSNFSHNPNKVGYIYLLTPKGIEQKSRLTTSFLKTKIEEFEVLRDEISKLKLDAEEIAINKQKDLIIRGKLLKQTEPLFHNKHN